jgi:CRISPR-associated protein Csy2
VRNARDATVPLRFVESVYSLGEWISPHRLTGLGQLLWHAETDEAKGLHRCRNGYQPPQADADRSIGAQGGTLDEWDDAEAYAYT